MIKSKALALISTAALAVVAASPASAANWTGTANYGVETVGPFDTYDFSNAGALLAIPSSATQSTLYYQSFVTRHMLGSNVAFSSLLNSGYEITVVANFDSTRTVLSGAETFNVTGGSFALYLDKSPDYNFGSDSGFSDGIKILEGTVTSGQGASVYTTTPAGSTGGGKINLSVTGYDTSVFAPDTIAAGSSAFTLNLGQLSDQPFLSTIHSVAGHNVTGNFLYAADGALTLTAVPEPESYAMLLAGLGMLMLIARRRVS